MWNAKQWNAEQLAGEQRSKRPGSNRRRIKATTLAIATAVFVTAVFVTAVTLFPLAYADAAETPHSNAFLTALSNVLSNAPQSGGRSKAPKRRTSRFYRLRPANYLFIGAMIGLGVVYTDLQIIQANKNQASTLLRETAESINSGLDGHHSFSVHSFEPMQYDPNTYKLSVFKEKKIKPGQRVAEKTPPQHVGTLKIGLIPGSPHSSPEFHLTLEAKPGKRNDALRKSRGTLVSAALSSVPDSLTSNGTITGSPEGNSDISFQFRKNTPNGSAALTVIKRALHEGKQLLNSGTEQMQRFFRRNKKVDITRPKPSNERFRRHDAA